VVVGVDGSPNARLAVEHAARRVGPEGELIVAHVVEAGSGCGREDHARQHRFGLPMTAIVLESS